MAEKKTTKPAVKAVEKKAEKKTIVSPEGKFVPATGRRKTATAQVRLFQKGTSKITVNGKNIEEYFSAAEINTVNRPIEFTGVKYDFSITLQGGGKKGQADAAQNGIAKTLLKVNPEWRPSFRAEGWLTRDARRKERKKPGLKRARRAPQWAKR